MDIFYFFILPIILLIIIEGVVAFGIGYRSVFYQKRIAICNLISNISLNIFYFLMIRFFTQTFSNNKLLAIIFFQLLIILFEYNLFKRFLHINSKQSAFLSVVVNIASYFGLRFVLSFI